MSRLREGWHYTLVKGHRLVPFGRQYQMLQDLVSGPIAVPLGYCWDGMTMVPMRYNSGLMRGVVVHDRLYATRRGSVSEADRAMDQVWAEDGIPWISRKLILAMLLWMRPTAIAYWHVTGSKLKLLPMAAVNAGMFPLLVWGLLGGFW